MLRPELYTFEMGPDLIAKIRPLIFEKLWDEAGRSNLKSLSISRAKELLSIAQPAFRDFIPIDARAMASVSLMPHSTLSTSLHEALAISAGFYRREGSDAFRQALHIADLTARTAHLWTPLFDRALSPWLRQQGHLDSADSIESVDIVVEAVRAWVADVSRRLQTGVDISPHAFFLDTESELEETLDLNGRKLRFRGRPDAIFIRPTEASPEVVEYKFGTQSQVELQVAQTILYLSLMNTAKGTHSDRASIQFFRLVGDTPPDAVVTEGPDEKTNVQSAKLDRRGAQAGGTAFPEPVQKAFEGYIGNAAAVRRLKVACAMALRESPVVVSGYMLCGPGGLGKTELARRVARALDLPFVDVPASTIKSVDDLLKRVRETLRQAGLQPEDNGSDSGLPRRKFPPLVVFLDEIHVLKNQDSFLNLFEPKERRAVGSKEVGDFSAASFLCATTDKGLLRGPFRSRFTTVDLEPYSDDEVAQIVAPVFRPQSQVSEEFLIALANMSRLNPRVALSRADELKKHHGYDPEAYPLTVDGLRRMARENWQIDDQGLTSADREYLEALASGPRGFSSLAQVLSAGEDEIRTVLEPYLQQLRLIVIKRKGRELTELGKRLVSAL